MHKNNKVMILTKCMDQRLGASFNEQSDKTSASSHRTESPSTQRSGRLSGNLENL